MHEKRREPEPDMEKGTGSRAPRETEEPEARKNITFLHVLGIYKILGNLLNRSLKFNKEK